MFIFIMIVMMVLVVSTNAVTNKMGALEKTVSKDTSTVGDDVEFVEMGRQGYSTV